MCPDLETGDNLSCGRLVLGDSRSVDCDGLPRRHEASVELVFIEEQQALARAAVLDLDLPRDSGGPRLAHLQNAIVWYASHAPRQSVRAPLVHELMHPLTLSLDACLCYCERKWVCEARGPQTLHRRS